MKITDSYYVRILDTNGVIKHIKDLRQNWYRGKTLLIWQEGNETVH